MQHVIIIGAMRSGTSTLYYHLLQHPLISECIVKEPEYFSTDNRPSCRYIDLWPSDNKPIKLEASTCYSKAPSFNEVSKHIFEYGISPKFIYIMRNPYERILAHYNLLPSSNNILKESVINTSCYYFQIRQYLKYFKEEDFLLLDFDELLNGNDVVKKVYKFLNIDFFPLKTYTVLGKNSKKIKTSLTENEKDYIFNKLKGDMLQLSSLGIDVKKWGF